MVIEYKPQSIFRLEKSNSASEYDTTPSEYGFFYVLLTTVLQLYLDHIINFFAVTIQFAKNILNNYVI
jgi:hypothetical protein